MALFVKDSEVDALAQELASLKHTTKTEAIRQALRAEIDREKNRLDLVAQSLAFARTLRKQAGPNAKPVGQAVRDELYGKSVSVSRHLCPGRDPRRRARRRRSRRAPSARASG